MDAHDLVAKVKELAIELGRTPTATEFEQQIKGGKYKYTKLFGGFTPLLKAAGLDTYDDRRCGKKQRIDNSVFERDVYAHLEAFKPVEVPKAIQGGWQRTLFIGDLHAPFSNLSLLDKIYRFAEREKPEVIVQIGDLYDHLSHSRFPRSTASTFNARQEQEAARAQAETMWSEVRKAAPAAKCYQLWGNHDARPLKRILEVYPEAEDWVSEMITRLMTFPGVETLDDTRQELMLPGNIMVHHGYRSRLGGHRDFAMLNAVVGHTHVGGVVYRQLRGHSHGKDGHGKDEILWELNCGLAAQIESKGLTYTNQRLSSWTPGWGWVDEYGPRFIPCNP